MYIYVPCRNRMECLQIQGLKQINILLKYVKENYLHSNNSVLSLFSQNKNNLKKLPRREVKGILLYQGFSRPILPTKHPEHRKIVPVKFCISRKNLLYFV